MSPIANKHELKQRKTTTELAQDLLVVQNAVKLLEEAIENVKVEDPLVATNENGISTSAGESIASTSQQPQVSLKRGRPKKNLKDEKKRLNEIELKLEKLENPINEETEKIIAKIRQNYAACKSRDKSSKKVELLDLLLECLKSEKKLLNRIHKRGEKKMKRLIMILI